MQALSFAQGQEIDIRIQDVPEVPMNEFASETLTAVISFFENPQVKEDFDKWLIDYKERKSR